MKQFTLTAEVEITMEIEAENLEEAAEAFDQAIYDRLDDVSHSIGSVSEGL